MLIHPLRSIFLTPAVLILTILSADPARGELLQRPGAAKVQAHYVIVTDFELAPSFEPLASHKQSHGTATLIAATEQIAVLYPEGRDLAESIRLFLQDAYTHWATRYVLLGGDPEIVPTRWVLVPDPTETVPSTPSDLYYGALDGDWDADGDGVFGELPSLGEEGDQIDTVPELMVGRALVSDRTEATNFVAKTLRFLASADRSSERSGLAMAGTLPLNPGITLSEISEAILVSAVESAAQPPNVERRYTDHEDWPGSLPLDPTIALERLREGDHDWVLAMLPGGPQGLAYAEETLDLDALASLSGSTHEFVFLTIAPESVGLYGPGPLKTLLSPPSGGAVAALGPATTMFVTVGRRFLTQFMTAALGSPGATLGEAFRSAHTLEPAEGNFEIRAHAGWFLLGDPQLTMYPQTVVANPAGPAVLDLHPPHPNPFNPLTEIVYDLSSPGRVEVAIFDMRGRRVRTLQREFREPGRHRLLWDGRDEDGRRLSSGVYLVKARAGGEESSRKLTLVR